MFEINLFVVQVKLITTIDGKRHVCMLHYEKFVLRVGPSFFIRAFLIFRFHPENRIHEYSILRKTTFFLLQQNPVV